MSDHANPPRDSTKESLEARLIKAIVKIILNTKGKRVTLRARLIVRIAGVPEEHTNIVRAAMLLKKLALKKLLEKEIRKRFTNSLTLNYVVYEGTQLWNMVRSSPEEAERYLLSIVSS